MSPSWIVVIVLGLTTAFAASPVPVAVRPKGETTIIASLGETRVRAKFHTEEVIIGPRGDGWLPERHTPCTYSRSPCSVLDGLVIFVNESQIFVSRSVFADLADVNTASVRREDGEMLLTLVAGDASEGIRVKIWFDGKSVTKRAVYSGMDLTEATEQTTYYLPPPLE